MNSDTIYALSSGRPPAAIAVVRVSGPHAGHAVMALAGRMPTPRRAMLARLRDAAATAIDDALVLWFPAPRSETGEDMAEFQIHGGRAVLTAVIGALGKVPGLRLAEPGEFTRRAFANGKLDLTQVEGLADLIGAETESQRRQALRHMEGLLGGRAERWRARLVEALALVEALIDFPDEGDVPANLLTPALVIAAELGREIRALLDDGRAGERLRDGLTVAIAGPVNVGKSSIINRIARRPAAIVSPYAGTTRDVIEVHLELEGYPVTVLDTAGLRHTEDPVEQEGVRRASARAQDADLVLWIVDGSAMSQEDPPAGFLETGAPPVWVIVNKADLISATDLTELSAGKQSREPFLVSALTGAGFDLLLEKLMKFAEDSFGPNEGSVIARQRHRMLLLSCADSLDQAIAESAGGREDIIAEELRQAAQALGRLTGRIDVEDVLDVLFRDFCIGK